MKILWKPKLASDGRPFPRVFLSASVPSLKRDERFLKGDVEPRLMARVIETRVRDAVASFVVQLLRAGGQLIFGGHPSIVPMVAAAAENFSNPSSDIFPIVLYQSRLFAESTPPVGREEMESSRISKTVWVPVDHLDASKEFNLSTPYLLDAGVYEELCKQEQYDKSLKPEVAAALVVLRVVMLLHLEPQTILSMGGMEGIDAEASLFRRLWEGRSRFTQSFALRSTYGATANLDTATTHFIDERFFASRSELEPSEVTRGTLLTPQADVDTASKQLMERIRYDGIMEELVHNVAGPS